MKAEDGITLLEVVITTILIGMLVSIATLSLSYYQTAGNKRLVEGDLATLTTAVRLFILDNGMPSSINQTTDLVPEYLPELPRDPFSKSTPPYYIVTVRTDPSDGNSKIYIGSCGPDGVVDYGQTATSDDIYKYIK